MTPPCRGRDTERWFSRNPEDREYALNHCLACPLRVACLEETLAVESLGPVGKGFVHGIAGGLTAPQRTKLIEPRCPRCHDPRLLRDRYCRPCAVVARAESRERGNAKKRVAS